MTVWIFRRWHECDVADSKNIVNSLNLAISVGGEAVSAGEALFGNSADDVSRDSRSPNDIFRFDGFAVFENDATPVVAFDYGVGFDDDAEILEVFLSFGFLVVAHDVEIGQAAC